MSNSVHATRIGEVLQSLRDMFDEAYEADDSSACDVLGRTRQTVQEAFAKAEEAGDAYWTQQQWCDYAARLRARFIEVATRHLSPAKLEKFARDLPTEAAVGPSSTAQQLEREISWSRKLFDSAVDKSDAKSACKHAKLLIRTEGSLAKENDASGYHLPASKLQEITNSYIKRVFAAGRPSFTSDDHWAEFCDDFLNGESNART